MKCRVCNFENKEYTLYCEQCGALLNDINKEEEIEKLNGIILDVNEKINVFDDNGTIINKMYSLFNKYERELSNFSLSTIKSLIALLTLCYDESELCVEMFYKISVLLKNLIPSNKEMYKYWMDLALKQEFKFALIEHMNNHIFGLNNTKKDLRAALNVSNIIINRYDRDSKDLFTHLTLLDKLDENIELKKEILDQILDDQNLNLNKYQKLLLDKVKLECALDSGYKFNLKKLKEEINEIFEDKEILFIDDSLLYETINALIRLDQYGLIKISKKEAKSYYFIMRNKPLSEYNLNNLRSLNYIIKNILNDESLFKDINNCNIEISNNNFKNAAKAY